MNGAEDIEAWYEKIGRPRWAIGPAHRPTHDFSFHVHMGGTTFNGEPESPDRRTDESHLGPVDERYWSFFTAVGGERIR